MTISLTPEQRAIYQARLTEAETAYHTLVTGGGIKVFVDQNGERIEYNAGSIRGLTSYIAQLRQLLGIGCPLGPLNIWY